QPLAEVDHLTRGRPCARSTWRQEVDLSGASGRLAAGWWAAGLALWAAGGAARGGGGWSVGGAVRPVPGLARDVLDEAEAAGVLAHPRLRRAVEAQVERDAPAVVRRAGLRGEPALRVQTLAAHQVDLDLVGSVRVGDADLHAVARGRGAQRLEGPGGGRPQPVPLGTGDRAQRLGRHLPVAEAEQLDGHALRVHARLAAAAGVDPRRGPGRAHAADAGGTG